MKMLDNLQKRLLGPVIRIAALWMASVGSLSQVDAQPNAAPIQEVPQAGIQLIFGVQDFLGVNPNQAVPNQAVPNQVVVVQQNAGDFWRDSLLAQFDTELRFVSHVCQLEKQQQTELKERFKEAVPELMQSLTGAQVQRNGVVVNPGFRFEKGVPATINPNSIMRDTMDQTIKVGLKPEQYEVYQKERAARDEFQRDTLIDLLLYRLSTRLLLTDSQLHDLREPLGAWASGHLSSLPMLIDQFDLIPLIPDDVMTPHLTRVQIQRWQSMVKRDMSSVGARILFQNQIPR